jgi:F-type H+-transporting ATPase subunit b
MEALGKLGIDFKVIIAQIINFGILFLILRHLLYRPILKVLENRQNKIKESLKKAEQIDQKFQQAEEQYKNRLSEANNEANKIIEEARLSAEKNRKAILEKAEQEADGIKSVAKAQIEEERSALYSNVKKSAGQLAVFILTKILKQDLDQAACQKTIDQALKEIDVK